MHPFYSWHDQPPPHSMSQGSSTTPTNMTPLQPLTPSPPSGSGLSTTPPSSRNISSKSPPIMITSLGSSGSSPYHHQHNSSFISLHPHSHHQSLLSNGSPSHQGLDHQQSIQSYQSGHHHTLSHHSPYSSSDFLGNAGSSYSNNNQQHQQQGSPSSASSIHSLDQNRDPSGVSNHPGGGYGSPLPLLLSKESVHTSNGGGSSGGNNENDPTGHVRWSPLTPPLQSQHSFGLKIEN